MGCTIKHGKKTCIHFKTLKRLLELQNLKYQVKMSSLHNIFIYMVILELVAKITLGFITIDDLALLLITC